MYRINKNIFIALFLTFSFSMHVKCKSPSSHGPADNIDRATPSATFAIISDPHMLAPQLLSADPAAHPVSDRKLLAESHAIFSAITEKLLADPVDILLIPGDLTKDGERISHECVAEFLFKLESVGTKVFVIPGNHDINNPHSFTYATNTPTRTPTVSASEFVRIYSNFGYAEAIESDTTSLSYIAEPIDGIYILALDACRYNENTTKSIVGGKFSQETLIWIEDRLEEARNAGKVVIGMMHHGLIEHFTGQSMFFTDYLVKDWRDIGARFAEKGMTLVCTGHFHAQDIIKLDTDDGFLFDMETGSSITYPCPYRLMTLTDGITLNIDVRYVEEIDYDTGPLSFADYARKELYNAISTDLGPTLLGTFSFAPDAIEAIMPHLQVAVAAHFTGDEKMTEEIRTFIDSLKVNSGFYQKLMAQYLEQLYTDNPPPDNRLIINLLTGAVEQF
ncbi:metallophosphoesterase [bacterium]|nr:metallophosphoesterase [bacterium]